MAANALLERLPALLATGTSAQVASLAGLGDRRAARELNDLAANVRALRVSHLSLRYVDEYAGTLSVAQQRILGPRDWVGDVQVAWRLAGFDRHDSHLEVPVTFRDRGSSAAFVTARRSYGQPAPLWMLSRVTVARRAESLVVTAVRRAAGRLAPLAARAVVDVRKVLPRWRGQLVVEVPRDQAQLNRVLGSEPGAYGEIAAVTTTVDGSTTPDAPVHIFVNPRVFDPLGPHGAQIVMSHEATHVATGAALSSMPTWLLEGFADFVALDHVSLPVSVTASQILAQVRHRGAPSRLPGRQEFDPQNKQLGASYESAWLACRLLARTYGEKRLIAFYMASQRDAATAGPFRQYFGTTQRAFTRAWRADLRRLAG